MNSFFGIGLPELIFIAIIALIVLGPERLPGVLRQMAQYFRQIRALTQEVTSQFSEELKAFDDINPAKIMNEVTQPVKDLNPKNFAKEIEKSAKDLQPKNIAKQMKDAAAGKPDGPTDSSTGSKVRKAQRTPKKNNTVKDDLVKNDSTKVSSDESENQIMPPESTEAATSSANGNSPTKNQPVDQTESKQKVADQIEEAS